MLKQTMTARARHQAEAGFTLIELMISIFVLMVISGVVFQGMLGLGRINDIVANRTEMHSGVRNATELLQQEVGQAGRISLPDSAWNPACAAPLPYCLVGTVAGPGIDTVPVSSTAGMFVGQHLVVDIGIDQEIVTLEMVDTAGQIRARFTKGHPAGAPLSVTGGFAEGVIPRTLPNGVDPWPNGSTGSVLKIVGDINDDGNMVYVEYTCDFAARRLYRNPMPYDAAIRPAPTVERVLLDNIVVNPGSGGNPGPPCFTYDEETVNGRRFVIGVAITLTVETQDPDPITKQFQSETKALLNVSPRNVFSVWQMASLGYTNRMQPLPPSVTQLLLP